MKGFVRVVGELEHRAVYGKISRLPDEQPKKYYVAIADIMEIIEIDTSETKLSDSLRARIMECFCTSEDSKLHCNDCEEDVCSCFLVGFKPEFYPLIIIRMRTDRHKEYLVYPDQQNRQLLMAPSDAEFSQETEILHQILQELQYGSPAGSEYNAARKRFYSDLEKE